MARSLTLGNGNLLVGLDQHAQVKDLHFPHTGQEAHLGTNDVHRVGVWINERLTWISDPEWLVSIDCDTETAVGKVKAINEQLGLTLHFTDTVYNEKNIFIRKVKVENLDKTEKRINLFFAQQFHISETRRGDTAYLDPRSNAILHYKGRRAFLVNALYGRNSFDDYTIGLFEIEGKEGSHLDAVDGMLAKNTIEHGSTDSVIGITMIIPGKKMEVVYYWMTIGRSVKEVRDLNTYVLTKSPGHIIKSTRDYWNAWVNRQNFTFYGLEKKIISLFKKSLIIVRSHADDGGAIIASSDSDILQHGRDYYAYMWPRDGAFAATALDRAGDFNVAHRFFEFCNDVVSPEGYFMHKYLADKALGSSWHPWVRNGKPELPIQEDETSMVLFALWNHYELSKDLEFIERIYNTLIKKSADFLKGYAYQDTHLPYPSYDLWEEKYGISTYTCAAKYGALIAAAKFARLLGKTTSEKEYQEAADNIREAILKHLYDEELGMFVKLVNISADGKMIYDKTIDMSSFYGIFKFGVLPADDERMLRARNTVFDTLENKNDVGGIIRYEGDRYYKVGMDADSNPWFITTLWMAQYNIALAKNENDLESVKDILQWVEEHALRSGVLSEQINSYTGEHLSVAPLTWSHSTYINTVIEYLEKLEELGVCVACNPINK